MGSRLAGEALRVYHELGGVQEGLPRFPALAWDMNMGGVAVELDEAQHFNRYRALTLESRVYEVVQGVPVTLCRHWCREREEEAVARQKQGPGFWSNASTERQFGISGRRGDLSGAGSSRYKQRAFYRLRA